MRSQKGKSSAGGDRASEPITDDSKRRRTSEEQRAEIERVAREHGADLSEEGFNEALRKVGRQTPSLDGG